MFVRNVKSYVTYGSDDNDDDDEENKDDLDIEDDDLAHQVNYFNT